MSLHFTGILSLLTSVTPLWLRLILPFLTSFQQTQNTFLPLKCHVQIPLCLWSHIRWCVAVIYLWDLLSPKREYNSLSLSDVHPYALFHLTAEYDCASIFFLQHSWIRAVTSHMPFYVWMETGHCRADKLLLELLVIEWNGWRATLDWRTAVSGVDAERTLYSSLIHVFLTEGKHQTLS